MCLQWANNGIVYLLQLLSGCSKGDVLLVLLHRKKGICNNTCEKNYRVSEYTSAERYGNNIATCCS